MELRGFLLISRVNLLVTMLNDTIMNKKSKKLDEITDGLPNHDVPTIQKEWDENGTIRK